MWGSRRRESSSSDYDDDYSSSGSIYDYRDEVKFYVNNNFYCNNVDLLYLEAYVSGNKITLKFRFAVYSGVSSWEINDAMSDVVRGAISSTGCPYDVSYSGEVTEHRY